MTNWPINSRIVNAEAVSVHVVFVNGHKVRWRMVQDAMDDFGRHIAGELRLTGPRCVSVPEKFLPGITWERCAEVLGADGAKGPSSIIVAFGPRIPGKPTAFCAWPDGTGGGFGIWIGVSSPMRSLRDLGILRAFGVMFNRIVYALLNRRSVITYLLRHEMYHTLGVPCDGGHETDGHHCTNSHCVLSGGLSRWKWFTGRLRIGTRFQHELCEACRGEVESARQATKQLIPPDAPYDAMEHFDLMVSLNPDNPEEVLRRAEEHFKRRDWEKALHDYTLALDVGPADQALLCRGKRPVPKDLLCLKNRGATFWQMGQYRQAADDYERCLHMKGDDINTLYNLANLLATCPDSAVRDGQRAVTLARQACELEKWRRPDLLALLASTFAEAGDFEQAARYQEKALAMSPDSQEYKSHLEMYKAEQARRIVPM